VSLKNSRRDRTSLREDRGTRTAFDGFSNRRSKSGQRRILSSLIIVCAVLATLVAADYWTNYGRIYHGIEVGDIPVGGKTPAEAREIVGERSAEALKEIRFSGEPGEFAVPAGEIGLDFDVDGTVDKAYAVGREGSVLKRLGDRAEAAWSTTRVSPILDYDREIIRDKIENLAERADSEPQDAYVAVSGSEAEPVESREGFKVDVEATAANVDEALDSTSGETEIVGAKVEPTVPTSAAREAAEKAKEAMSGPVTLTSADKQWKLSPAEIGQALSFTPEGSELKVGLDRKQLRENLTDVYKDLTVEPVEAGYKFSGDGISVTKSEAGKKIDEEELLRDLESGLFEGKRAYEVPVVTDDPNLTTEKAEQLKPTALLGTYRTNYTLTSDHSEDRVDNLRIASNAISGTLLAPGEVFSADETLSPLDYNMTKVIIEGREEKADGGGLCQVSSTLYMAANYAGLDIVERHPHYAQLPYIRPGLDATVWFGALDMKFKNTTDGYIFVREYVADDNYIYAEIWGQPTGKEVEMDSEPEYVGPDYSKWITYKKVKENGEVVSDDVLYSDVYKPLTDENGKVFRPDSEEVTVAPVDY
jgi:vancomycin resistance protein YoaR